MHVIYSGEGACYNGYVPCMQEEADIAVIRQIMWLIFSLLFMQLL